MNSSSEKFRTKIINGYNQFLCAEDLLQNKNFSLSLLEDFNRLNESIVLYDEISVISNNDFSGSPILSKLLNEKIITMIGTKDVNDVLNRPDNQKKLDYFISEIFKIDDQKFTVDDLMRRISPKDKEQQIYNKTFKKVINCYNNGIFDKSSFSDFLHQNIYLTRESGGHFYYLGRALIYSIFAESKNMDYASDFLRLPLAALCFAKKEPLSVQLYRQLSENLKSQNEDLVKLGAPLSIYIPPITEVLLSKINNEEDYIEEVLRLRNKFKKYRNTYREYTEIITDPNLSLKKKLKYKKDLKDDIETKLKSDNWRNTMFIKTLFKLPDLSIESIKSPSNITITSLLTKVISLIIEEIKFSKVRALFDLETKAINIEYYSYLVENRYGVKINEIDKTDVKNYAMSINSILNNSLHEPTKYDFYSINLG